MLGLQNRSAHHRPSPGEGEVGDGLGKGQRKNTVWSKVGWGEVLLLVLVLVLVLVWVVVTFLKSDIRLTFRLLKLSEGGWGGLS